MKSAAFILVLLSFLIIGISCQQKQGNKEQDDLYELDNQIWDLMDDVFKEFGHGKTWFDVFELAEEASGSEIQAAYRKLSIQYHPDKNNSEEAARKFKIMASIAKLLKSEESRRRYEYHLVHGIPFWRGRYFYRKSEDISVLVSILLVLLFGSSAQYVLQILWYKRVVAGLELVRLNRDKSLRMKKGSRPSSPVGAGLFDDANLRSAMEYLVLKKGIPVEAVVDQKEWVKYVKLNHNGDEKAASSIEYPSIFDTLIFYLPRLAFRKLTQSSTTNAEK